MSSIIGNTLFTISVMLLLEHASSVEKIIFSDPKDGAIKKMDLDGGNLEDFVTAVTPCKELEGNPALVRSTAGMFARPTGFDFDVNCGKMFFSDWLGGRNEGGDQDANIQFAPISGSNRKAIVTANANVEHMHKPWDVKVDSTNAKVYWSDLGKTSLGMDYKVGGKILRCNYDGSNVETLIDNLVEPSGIALDVAGGKMYFTERNHGKGKALVRRSDLDGSNLETIGKSSEFAGLDGLTLAEGQVVFVETGLGRISYVPMDGSRSARQPFSLYSDKPLKNKFTDLFYHAGSKKLYFVNSKAKKIQRLTIMKIGQKLYRDRDAGVEDIIELKGKNCRGSANCEPWGVQVVDFPTSTDKAACKDTSLSAVQLMQNFRRNTSLRLAVRTRF